MTLDLPILLGTVRSERRSIWVARHVHSLLHNRPGVETHLWDPADLPFVNLVHREWEMPKRPAAVDDFALAMGRADGFVIVTPEYNYGIPSTLKNLIDHPYDEWNRKPFGSITAGGIAGGVQAQEQLRQVIAGIRAVTIPTCIPIPHIGTSWDSKVPRADQNDWDSRFGRFFVELEWCSRALKSAREESSRIPPTS